MPTLFSNSVRYSCQIQLQFQLLKKAAEGYMSRPERSLIHTIIQKPKTLLGRFQDIYSELGNCFQILMDLYMNEVI